MPILDGYLPWVRGHLDDFVTLLDVGQRVADVAGLAETLDDVGDLSKLLARIVVDFPAGDRVSLPAGDHQLLLHDIRERGIDFGKLQALLEKLTPLITKAITQAADGLTMLEIAGLVMDFVKVLRELKPA